jgi:hypothetical protein
MPIPTPRELWTLHQWSPLLGYARRLSETLDARERADIVADATEWVAAKLQVPVVARLAARVAAVVRTPEGVELLREAVAVSDKVIDSLPKEV